MAAQLQSEPNPALKDQILAQLMAVRLRVVLIICFVLLATLGYLENGAMSVLIGSMVAFMLFLSVTLHELGHALAAKFFKIETHDIALYPFGGIARIKSTALSIKEEILISLAGPATNIAIAILCIPLLYFNIYGSAILFALNVLMGVFNLVPAYPMDGGRILRATLSYFIDKDRATKIAVYVSRLFSATFLFLGVYYGMISLFIIGIFLIITARPDKNYNRQ